MAKKTAKRGGEEERADLLGPRETVRGSSAGVLRAAAAAGTTGRFIAVFRPGEAQAGVRELRDKAGVAAPANTADSDSGALDPNEIDGENVLFDKLDMAVVELDPDQRGAATAAIGGPVLMMVPETIKSTGPPLSALTLASTGPMLVPETVRASASLPMQVAAGGMPLSPAPVVPWPGASVPAVPV